MLACLMVRKYVWHTPLYTFDFVSCPTDWNVFYLPFKNGIFVGTYSLEISGEVKIMCLIKTNFLIFFSLIKVFSF